MGHFNHFAKLSCFLAIVLYVTYSDAKTNCVTNHRNIIHMEGVYINYLSHSHFNAFNSSGIT